MKIKQTLTKQARYERLEHLRDIGLIDRKEWLEEISKIFING